MSESLGSITLSASLIATLQNVIDGVAAGASAQQGFSFRPAVTLTSGTGANQADRTWTDTGRTLTSGNSENLDLYDLAAFDIGAGAGKSALGQAVTLAELVALIVWNKSTSTGNLLVGGEGSAAAWQSCFHVSGTLSDTAGLLLKPGGLVLLFAPTDPAYAVVDTSNHLLKFAASGGDCTYDAALLGRSG